MMGDDGRSIYVLDCVILWDTGLVFNYCGF